MIERYNVVWELPPPRFIEDNFGDWCRWEDVERLQCERDKALADVQRMSTLVEAVRPYMPVIRETLSISRAVPLELLQAATDVRAYLHAAMEALVIELRAHIREVVTVPDPACPSLVDLERVTAERDEARAALESMRQERDETRRMLDVAHIDMWELRQERDALSEQIFNAEDALPAGYKLEAEHTVADGIRALAEVSAALERALSELQSSRVMLHMVSKHPGRWTTEDVQAFLKASIERVASAEITREGHA